MINKIKNFVKLNNLDGYVVPKNDEYFTEYSKTNKLEIVAAGGTVEVDNIGTYDEAKGTIDLVGFNPSAIVGSSILFSVVPANESTIRPLRNFILDIDTQRSSSSAILDFQNTAVTL